MIDKFKLNKEVQDAAKMYLSDINQMTESELRDNLEHFAGKCKKKAEGILEEYVFANVSRYTESEFTIQDVDTLGQFVNFRTGYQAQMLNWIKSHPIEISEEVYDFPNKPIWVDNTDYITPKSIIIGGSVLALGLFIFTNFLTALAAEVLTILLAKQQSIRISNNAEQRKREMEHYNVILQNKKDDFIKCILVELEKWLNEGEEKSKEILSTYNL